MGPTVKLHASYSYLGKACGRCSEIASMTWGYGLAGPLLMGLEEASLVPVPHAISTLAFLIIRSGLLIRRKGKLGLLSLTEGKQKKRNGRERGRKKKTTRSSHSNSTTETGRRRYSLSLSLSLSAVFLQC